MARKAKLPRSPSNFTPVRTKEGSSWAKSRPVLSRRCTRCQTRSMPSKSPATQTMSSTQACQTSYQGASARTRAIAATNAPNPMRAMPPWTADLGIVCIGDFDEMAMGQSSRRRGSFHAEQRLEIAPYVVQHLGLGARQGMHIVRLQKLPVLSHAREQEWHSR